MSNGSAVDEQKTATGGSNSPVQPQSPQVSQTTNTVPDQLPPTQQTSPPTSTPPPSSDEKSQTGLSSLKGKILIGAIALVVMAIVAGGAFYWWNLNKKLQPEQAVQELKQAGLVLASPADQEATTSSEILVSGRTNPRGLVAAYSESFEEIYESNENGDFLGTFILEEGPNDITFTAFGVNNKETSEARSVVYVMEEEL